jgi:hypothetical protein
MVIRTVAIVFLLGLSLLLTGQEPEEDPHSVPKCDVQARNGAHECHCTKMVADAQEQHGDHCRRDSQSSEEMHECMRNMPAPCDIIAHPSTYGVGDHRDKCKTWCRRDRCFCNDGPCPPEDDEGN